ncbi:gamma-glutamylcyclotransferase family protein [Actinoplanes sp. CA-131856]
MKAKDAVFVYGSLMHPATLATLCGPEEYFPASLTGWARTWTVCTDNTIAGNRVFYLDPAGGERLPVQVLFLNVEQDSSAGVSGILVPVTAEQLRHLDEREGNYDRVDVTPDVRSPGIPHEQRPGTIWVYVGKDAATRAAKRGIASRTAVIWDAYLERVVAALESYDGFLDEFNGEDLPVPRDRILALDRRNESGGATDPYSSAGSRVDPSCRSGLGEA